MYKATVSRVVISEFLYYYSTGIPSRNNFGNQSCSRFFSALSPHRRKEVFHVAEDSDDEEYAVGVKIKPADRAKFAKHDDALVFRADENRLRRRRYKFKVGG